MDRWEWLNVIYSFTVSAVMRARTTCQKDGSSSSSNITEPTEPKESKNFSSNVYLVMLFRSPIYALLCVLYLEL